MGRYRESHVDFGPVDDDYRGFDLREDDAARGPLILVLAVGVLIVFGAVVWNTYRQGVRGTASEVPVIRADAGPYKFRPEDAGGETVPGLDRRIYDQFDGSERMADLQGAADQAPEVRPRRVGNLPSLTADNPDPGLQGGPPIELRPGRAGNLPEDDTETSRDMPDDVARQVERLANLDAAEAEAERDYAAVREVPLPRPSSPSRAPDPTPDETVSPEPATSPRFQFASDGAFVVQIAAFRSREAADEAWARSARQAPDLYGPADKMIQRADLGARGVFYRLRAGAFASRDEATAFCDAVKAAGGDCIVAQR